MTFGQLFTTMHPDVRVIENGSCVWLFMDEVNHYTIATKWWNQEVAGYALDLLKEQEKIVRCKDCKYLKDNRCLNDNVHYSIDDCGCQPSFYVTDDWFCAEGERR